MPWLTNASRMGAISPRKQANQSLGRDMIYFSESLRCGRIDVIQKEKGACARFRTEVRRLRTCPLLDRGLSSCLQYNKIR